METVSTLGLDVGATSIKGAVVEDGGTIRQRASRPTPSEGTSEEIAAAIAGCIDELRAEAQPAAVGLAAAGWVAADRRTVVFSANFPAWHDEPLAQRIEQLVGLPVVLENDANAAAWGEFRFGAAADATSMAAITLGSGVGGALIVDGALVRGHQGAAGEIGHSVMITAGYPCACGRQGCAENYVSGRSVNRRARETLGERDLYAAARAGDARALQAYGELGRYLGIAIADTVMLVNPQRVVVGGGVTDAYDLFVDAAIASLRAELGPSWAALTPEFAVAVLGVDAGTLGAADLAGSIR